MSILTEEIQGNPFVISVQAGLVADSSVGRGKKKEVMLLWLATDSQTWCFVAAITHRFK